MNEPRIGQRVLTADGEGTIDTITASNSDTNIFLYRITTAATRSWLYLDEIITISEPAATA